MFAPKWTCRESNSHGWLSLNRQGGRARVANCLHRVPGGPERAQPRASRKAQKIPSAPVHQSGQLARGIEQVVASKHDPSGVHDLPRRRRLVQQLRYPEVLPDVGDGELPVPGPVALVTQPPQMVQLFPLARFACEQSLQTNL